MRDQIGKGGPSALLIGVAVGAALTMVGCGSELSPPSAQSGVRARVNAAATTPTPSTTEASPPPESSPSAAPTESFAGAVTVGLGDNGTTVVVQVGQELVVTLPDPSERELTHELVKSSDIAVLRLIPATQPQGQLVALVRVIFRAEQVGVATVTASGTVPFRLQVEVVAD
ncbi:MAG: hypothetical protein WB801_02160 [Candidatus Dormiibacterota bacterium]